MAQTTSSIVANLTDAQVAAIIAAVQALSVSQVPPASADGPILTGPGVMDEAAAPLPVMSVPYDAAAGSVAAQGDSTTTTSDLGAEIGASTTVITSTAAATATIAAATTTAGAASSTASATTSNADIPDVHGGIICAQCGHFNPNSEIRWYAITRGKEVGVFNDWLIVHPLVSGVPHAAYKRYKTQAAAEVAFEEALFNDAVRIIV